MTDYRPPDIAEPAHPSGGSPVIAVSPYAKVVFGTGSLREVARLAGAARRPAVIGTPGRASECEQVAALLPGEPLLVAEAVMHTPVSVSERVSKTVADESVDLLVSIGGGSAIGLGKALTKRLGLRHIAVPTTYAGSEITPILGESDGGDKLTSRDDALRPEAVIYDPALLAALPPAIAAASGMNAMAHSVEALIVSDDPDIVRAARRSIELFAQALPAIVANPADKEARARGLYAAWLAAYCLAEVPMALHHKLCHALGGAFNMPHAQTHAAILPYTAGYNLAACPAANTILSEVLGGAPAGKLHDLVARLGLPTSLAEIGLPEDGIPVVAKAACANPYANPRPFDEAAIAALLRQAWLGKRPESENSDA